MAASTKVHVFINRRKVEFDTETVSVETFLSTAGFSGTEWDVYRLQGEGDPTGGILITKDQPITLKNGEHFRVIPGNRTFGAGSRVCS